ncbi:MAG: VanZ family protein, partial [Gammaproteobacteria bacterium]
MSAPRHLRWIVALSVALILAAALRPVPTSAPIEASARFTTCVICGDRGVADAILNVLLFAPLGVALALGPSSGRRVVVLAGALSAAIEILQLAIAGRHASLGDVIFNALGATLGLLLVRRWGALFHAPPTRAARLSLVVAVLAVGVFGLTGYFLAPAFPLSSYHARWTPTVNVTDPYRGRVLAASVGGEPLPAGPLTQSASITPALRGGEPFRVTIVAGPPPSRMAPIVGIYDYLLREIAIIGADGQHLVWRYRTRGRSWRLDQPDLQITRALGSGAVRIGDTIDVVVRRNTPAWTVEVNERLYRRGFSVGWGWGWLLPLERVTPRTATLLGFCWMAGLLLPFGYWARLRWESLMAAGMV